MRLVTAPQFAPQKRRILRRAVWSRNASAKVGLSAYAECAMTYLVPLSPRIRRIFIVGVVVGLFVGMLFGLFT